MPSINQLFGNNDGGEGSEVDFDVDRFLAEADSIIKTANERGRAPWVQPEAIPIDDDHRIPIPSSGSAVGDPASDPTLREGEPAPAPAVAPIVAAEPVAPADPLLELLRTVTPERREAMLRAAAGIDPNPPPPYVEPSLPDEIDPSSFEATLWREQQETRRTLSEISGAVRKQNEMTEQQRASQAAVMAGNAFQARYGFTPDETLEIAKYAGQSGIAGRFAATRPDDLVTAYDEALEHVLWTNPTFRQKVVGEASPGGVSPATTPAPSAEAQAAERKRILTSLSGAASPVAAGAPRVEPLESRPDGRLTEKSRQQIVRELATGIARSVTTS